MSKVKLPTLVAAAVLLTVGLSLACRFNVRDVGFVDLGSESYRYYCFVDSETPEEQAKSIRQVAGAAFIEANVAASVIDLDQPGEAETLAFYRQAGSPKAPAAVLVSADGKRSLAMPLVDESVILQESLWSNMERVYESPARDKVIEASIENYGVIVIVEGDDTAENARVRGLADETVKRIAAALGKLEKEIKNPPVVHVISAADALDEGVFLWSLGIDTGDRSQPAVTVLYGRGRQIGSVLEGESITGLSLYQIAGTIGLNCECGLDRTWMQGAMIPMKWEDERQKVVAKLLGFDAEDPKIKMEMSQILSKGGGAREGRADGTEAAVLDIDALLASYQEVVGGAGEGQPGPVAPVPTTTLVADALPPPDGAADGAAPVTVYVLAALVVAVLAGGAVIFLLGRSKSG